MNSGRSTASESNLFLSFIAGGIAGSVSKTCTAPLSRVTILYQVSSILETRRGAHSQTVSASLLNGFRQRNVFEAINQIVKEESFLSLWKGNLTSVIHRFPYSAFNFLGYEYSKTLFTKVAGVEENSSIRFACGAIAGGLSCFICYPLDLLRTKLSVIEKTSCGRKRAGIVNTLNDILHVDGIKGLYRGCALSVVVSIPNFALSYSVYGGMKERLIRKNMFLDHRTGSLTSLGSIVSGAVSGVVCSFAIFPIDSLRRKMQVSHLTGLNSNPSAQYLNECSLKSYVPFYHYEGSNVYIRLISQQLLHADRSFGLKLETVLRKLSWSPELALARRDIAVHGLTGLYRGIVPEILKVVPGVAIVFCTYEYVMGQFR